MSYFKNIAKCVNKLFVNIEVYYKFVLATVLDN